MFARKTGIVVRCLGDAVVAVLPAARVGEPVAIRLANGAELRADVTDVARGRVRLAPTGATRGIAVGDRVVSDGGPGRVGLGSALLGRAVDGNGTPLDGKPAPPMDDRTRAEARTGPTPPGERRAVTIPFETRIPALDAFLTAGRGARIGIFGPPGAGKSSLLEAIVAGARADAIVLALVGERGREAQRWIAVTDARATVVCATSDCAADERVAAADLAMRQAERLRERGLHVLLVVDSLARLVTALRERRAASREPVGRGGYPAGVWTDLARYLERAGNVGIGSITMFATVLSEGSDENDPLSEAARSFLDGHIVLSSMLARAGRFPAIDILASTSRTMADVVDADHARAAADVRAALALLAESRDARDLGLLTAPGPALAAAVAADDAIESFVRSHVPAAFARTRATLLALAASCGR